MIELRTERLLLRRFRATDADDALAYRNDAAFVRFLPHIPFPFTRADAEAFVRLNMTEDWRTSPTFAVVLEDTLIGTVNVEVDVVAKSAMLGYAIGRQWWGRGVATEAATSAITWARQEFGLKRLWASTDLRNVKSQRVLEKLGFERESVGAAHGPDREGREREEVVYGLDLTA